MKTFLLIVFGVSFFVGLILLFSTFRTVDSGEIGVVTTYGKVTGRVLDPGLSMVNPFTDDVLTYNTKKVTYETAIEPKQKGSKADYKDFPVDTNTLDGQPVDISYTIRFSVDPTKVTWVASSIGNQEALVEKIVKTESRIWARNVPRRFEAEKLYTGEGSVEVQNQIFEALKPKFEENGLILDTVGIREITFDSGYVSAIKVKQEAAVRVETERNIAEQAKFQKEAAITQAEAQAEAQRLQRETLDDKVLTKLQLEVQRLNAEALKISAEKGIKIVPDTVLSNGNGVFYTLPNK